MIHVDSDQWLNLLSMGFWPFLRIMALISTAPILSERSISKKVKIGLALMITWIVAPTLPMSGVTIFSPSGFWLAAQQILIGIMLGFTMQFAFAAIRTAGEIIGLQMGPLFRHLLRPRQPPEYAGAGALYGYAGDAAVPDV